MMARITIDDPDIHTVKNTDAQGRVYLGKDWQCTQIRLTVETIEDSDA